MTVKTKREMISRFAHVICHLGLLVYIFNMYSAPWFNVGVTIYEVLIWFTNALAAFGLGSLFFANYILRTKELSFDGLVKVSIVSHEAISGFKKWYNVGAMILSIIVTIIITVVGSDISLALALIISNSLAFFLMSTMLDQKKLLIAKMADYICGGNK